LILSEKARQQIDKHYVPIREDSPKWREGKILFSHVADLLNETYGNQSQNFTVGKFVHVLGHVFMQDRPLEEKLTMLKVANELGLGEVEAIRAKMKNGRSLASAVSERPEAFRIYHETQQACGRMEAEERPATGFAQSFQPLPNWEKTVNARSGSALEVG
jgi:hypothetical protein